MNEKFCGNCRFAGEEKKDYDDGSFRFCRRYPPTVVVIDEKEVFRFPEVHDTEWCGEWQPKPDKAEEWLDKANKANKRMENKGRCQNE